jgi:sortase A
MRVNSAQSRKIKRRLAYIIVPIFFAFLGLLILLLALRPLYLDAQNYLGFVLADSAPDFNGELTSIYKGTSVNKKTISNSKINLPDYNEQYADLSCDSLGINAPVYWGDSDLVLRYGVGTFAGSSLPGYGSAVLIAGHNTTFFKPLKRVQVGQIFKIRTNYGNYEYEVKRIEKHEYNDISAVDFNIKKEQLILYTCYPFNRMAGVKTQRLFVYCDKKSGPVITGVEEN